jgi:hypothetical protein
MSCIAAAGPAATASTRKPFPSSSVAAAAAVGDGAAIATTTVKAPLTMRSVPRFESVAVASDIFVAGSNGLNWDSLGGFGETFSAAAERMAASTGSCPPSELARAAIVKTCASSKPGIGWTFVTES